MALQRNPFDIIRTEDFNTNYKIIAKYFSDPKASYYSNLIRRGNVILVGTRGSGKSMLLKSLYLPVHIEILKIEGKDPLSCPIDFVGILINCERYEFKIFRHNIFEFHKKGENDEKVIYFWKQCMGHYFALILIEEMLNTVINYGPQLGLDLGEADYTKLFREIRNVCQLEETNSDNSSSFDSLGRMLRIKRKHFYHLMNKSILEIDFSIANNRFDLSAVIEVAKILRRIPRFENARFYILLDDFFFPNLSDEQQKIVLELIRVRNEPLAFKVATVPGGMVFKDDSGFELMPRGDEFIIESIEYPELGENSDYFRLVKDIVNNRLKEYDLEVNDIFKESSDSITEFLSKLKGEQGKGHIRPYYAGFGNLIHMSSGVIRTFLMLAKKIIDELLKFQSAQTLNKSILPVSVDIQTEVINTESSSFLDSIESMEDGLLLSKLVYFVGNESRKRLLNNPKANEYIQLQIKDYGVIDRESQIILTKAVTNNVFHSYQLAHRTTRRGFIAIRSLIVNRLLTPALRIPFRDRWRMDFPANKISEILGTSNPIDISDHKPQSQLTFDSKYCPVISDNCNRIKLDYQGDGCFYASPIRTDWTSKARDLFKKQFPKFVVAIEHPPNGSITCKICEMIHNSYHGIYELTDLNENVLFELSLALSRMKHAFFVLNTEWPIQQIEALLGQEYIPYNVVESQIAKICEEKINQIIDSGQEPWNATLLNNMQIKTQDNSILLVMPKESPYYEKTLTVEVKQLLESDLNYKVALPTDYSGGDWFYNLLKDVVAAKYCIIDTTRLPSQYDTSEQRFTKKELDYLHRIFIFGLTVGLRKTILHGYNTAYNKKVFTDMQGHCHFKYDDSSLIKELRNRVPMVFHE
jgi:hypothetical protein